MNWKEVGGVVADAAPFLGTLLGGPLGGAVGGIVASVFGTAENPSEVAQAIKVDPQSAVKLAEIEAEVKKRHVELATQVKLAELQADTQRLATVNATMQAELTAAVAGAGMFRTGWRPAFGWVMALAFGWLMAAIGVLLLTEPEKVGAAVAGISALNPMWMVGLGVLGVTVWKRSDDKRLAFGQVEGLAELRGAARRVMEAG